MKFFIKKKHVFIIVSILFIFLLKIAINNLLLAENGDTYDFFKIAYFLKNLDWTVESKRMPFLPFLLSFASPENFIQWGRIVINVFYFGSVVVFYLYMKEVIRCTSKQVNKKIDLLNYQLPITNFYAFLASLVFATNIIILENSFYILADTVFLFWNLLFLYILKKYGTSKYVWLSLIAGLAFYTRPEGALLYVVLVITIFFEIFKTKKDYNQITSYLLLIIKVLKIVFLATLLVAPYFLRNYVLYKNLFYSGYLDDQAGFIFNTKTVLLRLSNFLFGLGGIWFIPVLYLLLKTSILCTKFFISGINKLRSELVTLFLYSTALFLWGPYIRLYTVPISLLIIFIFISLKRLTQSKITMKNIIVTVLLTGISLGIYLYVVQKYNYTDLGYRKLGKGFAIIGSMTILIYFYLFFKDYISKKVLIIFFTLTLIFFNLTIFADKFRFIRYKYVTIKNAVNLYLKSYKQQGNLAYSNESGLEEWYLKDFDKNYKYYNNNLEFKEWAIKNNIEFVLVTEEFGFKDYLMGTNALKDTEYTVIKSYKSPFFYGDTKLIKLELKD